MSSRSLAPTAPNSPVLPSAISNAWSFSPPLFVFVIASALLAGIAAIGMVVDPRIVVGMPNWAKSLKFGMSLTLYGLTLLWMLPMATRWPRLTKTVAHAIGAILTFEVVVLAIQAVRGRAMHFNVATPLDAGLWKAMSATIFVLWGFTLLGAILLLLQRFPDRVLAWSIRLGFVIMLIGLTQGFLMPGPNAAQRAALAAGQQLDLIGAHTVGGFDGGPGLPLLGWSTDHGDLRIGHFVGIHGIQVIPLLGALLLTTRARRLPTGHRLLLVLTGALGYLGLVGLVTWQALRDQPLLAPDGLTVAAGLGLVTLTTVVAGIILAHGRRTGPATPSASGNRPSRVSV